jgi:predicted deacylase
MVMPVHVVRGKKDGPILLLCAAIHGDELNGIEIIRRILQLPALSRIKGTIVAVPVVNVYGLIHHSRYLPDRRDLNRSFPGSEKGSLAARVAHIFLEELVAKCTHGIDLHTGAIHRSNLPQIRANLDDQETLEIAKAFGAPVILNSNLRDGSLREAADERGVDMLLYETGEALRFDEVSIRGGVKGVVNVLRHLGMLPKTKRKSPLEPVIARSSKWVRATSSGLLKTVKPLGARVKRYDLLALVDDPLGDNQTEIKAPFSGIIIGRTEIPLVHEGEAVFHIARFEDLGEAEERVDEFHDVENEKSIPGLEQEPPVI